MVGPAAANHEAGKIFGIFDTVCVEYIFSGFILIRNIFCVVEFWSHVELSGV